MVEQKELILVVVHRYHFFAVKIGKWNVLHENIIYSFVGVVSSEASINGLEVHARVPPFSRYPYGLIFIEEICFCDIVSACWKILFHFIMAVNSYI